MNTTQIPSLFWTSRETAKALSISERSLWTLTKRGELPCIRIGRAVRYDPTDVRAWIESQKLGTNPLATGEFDKPPTGEVSSLPS